MNANGRRYYFINVILSAAKNLPVNKKREILRSRLRMTVKRNLRPLAFICGFLPSIWRKNNAVT